MIKHVLFDLDGTLLPMDQDEFTKGYFQILCKKMLPYGYDPNILSGAIWKGTGAMVANDGSATNEEVFWSAFSKLLGNRVLEHRYLFEEFYAKEFDGGQVFCGCNPLAAETVAFAREKGFSVALATNPLFPRIATEKRIRWAGCNVEDFELITCYEDSSHCKPNPDYYREVLERLDWKPEECLMVGNDVTEDMVAATVGMQVFLLTDCLINKEHADISVYPQAGFAELQQYLGACQ